MAYSCNKEKLCRSLCIAVTIYNLLGLYYLVNLFKRFQILATSIIKMTYLRTEKNITGIWKYKHLFLDNYGNRVTLVITNTTIYKT